MSTICLPSSGALFQVTDVSYQELSDGADAAAAITPPSAAFEREYTFNIAVDTLRPDSGMINRNNESCPWGPVDNFTFKVGLRPLFKSGELFIIVASSDTIKTTGGSEEAFVGVAINSSVVVATGTSVGVAINSSVVVATGTSVGVATGAWVDTIDRGLPSRLVASVKAGFWQS
jgi:hypothetical protein